MCMKRVLPGDAFERWLVAFLPRLGKGEPATLRRPAAVLDRGRRDAVRLPDDSSASRPGLTVILRRLS